MSLDREPQLSEAARLEVFRAQQTESHALYRLLTGVITLMLGGLATLVIELRPYENWCLLIPAMIGCLGFVLAFLFIAFSYLKTIDACEATMEEKPKNAITKLQKASRCRITIALWCVVLAMLFASTFTILIVLTR